MINQYTHPFVSLFLNYGSSRSISPAFYVILLLSIIIGCLIFGVRNRLKICRMMDIMGFDKIEQYKAYKQSCPLNYENKFMMSDEWVINEYSYKVYRTSDITNVSASYKNSPNPGQYKYNYRPTHYEYSIIINSANGDSDSFSFLSVNDRDRLLKSINEFLNRSAI